MTSVTQKDMEQAVDEWLDDLADKIFARSQDNLINDGKVDTGTLLKTANIKRERLRKEIVYPAPHAPTVHFGRLPGTMPPLAPIEDWCRRVLKAENPRATAWAVAQAIKERGIEATPFLQDAIDEETRRLP